MLPHKEFSFLFLDLFSFPQSIKLKSFKRTTLVASYVHFKQKKKNITQGREYENLHLTTDSHQT